MFCPTPDTALSRPLSLAPGETFSAGREPDCDLVLQDWMFAEDSSYQLEQTSRHHFELYRRDGKTFIVSKSANRTFVHGVRLGKEEVRVLKHGDSIAVLSPDMELFWYLDEATMIYLNSFPLKIISKYLVGNEVGSGSFGVVRKGFSRSDFLPVALKFLPKTKGEMMNLYMAGEVDILRQLSHPCVTKLKDVVEDKKSLVIVMEFADGGELEDQVRDGLIDHPL